MRITDRILVVVDPDLEDDQVAIRRGAWLASQRNVGIELFIAFSDAFAYGDIFPDTRTIERARSAIAQQHQERLDTIARSLRESGLDVKVSVVWDAPLDDAIIRHAAKSAPSVVIKGTSYHSAIGSVFLNRADWGLIRRCPFPLLLTKDGGWTTGAPVVAAIDPLHAFDRSAALDERILDAADALSGLTSAELHVFHSYLLPMQVLPGPAYIPEGMQSRETETAKLHSNAISAFLESHGCTPDAVHLEPGNATKLLPALVNELQAGLVVMGAVNRKLLDRVLLGSTTEQVVGKLGCDLLVVKPSWFSTSVSTRVPKHYRTFTPIDDSIDNLSGL
ncbi:MAG: universal stress protein [Pseudomonadota bacterium]